VHDDAATSSAVSMATQATHLVDPLCLAAAGSTAACAIKDSPSDDKNLNLDENSEHKEKIVDKDILKNGELNGDTKACNTDNIDIDAEDQIYHNAGTIRFRNNKKTGSNNTDLDSIEHLDFDEEDGKKNEAHLDDDIDSVCNYQSAAASCQRQ
jgi:hypothetical protein